MDRRSFLYKAGVVIAGASVVGLQQNAPTIFEIQSNEQVRHGLFDFALDDRIHQLHESLKGIRYDVFVSNGYALNESDVHAVTILTNNERVNVLFDQNGFECSSELFTKGKSGASIILNQDQVLHNLSNEPIFVNNYPIQHNQMVVVKCDDQILANHEQYYSVIL